MPLDFPDQVTDLDPNILLGANATNPAKTTITAAGRAAIGANGRTVVADVDYTALATDRLVSFTTLTAPRTVTLPSGAVFTPGQELVVNDESGAASAVNVITIAASGGELIDGVATEIIRAAFAMRRLYRTATGWTFDKGVVRASNNLSDLQSAATARTNLDVPSVADAMLISFIYGG